MIHSTAICKKGDTINELTDVGFLSGLFGDIVSIEKQILKTSGFSGSNHEKITLHLAKGDIVSLVLKRVVPSKDMTIWRSGNVVDREVRLIESEELKDVWNIIQSPYVAYAKEGEDSALLMLDLSDSLFPDVREPIAIEQEDLMLLTLSRLHTKFWERKMVSTSWLTNDQIFFDFLGPQSSADVKNAGREHPIFTAVQAGWHLAFQLMPPELRSFVLEPPTGEMLTDLPRTLIHGDSKLANFAILRNEKVSAFDWTVVAYACPGIEIGWYIAVNASRLARPKEKVLHQYHQFLQRELGKEISDEIWNRMMNVAIMAGARMLLWNKALNVEKNIAGAKEEWVWWIEELKKTKIQDTRYKIQIIRNEKGE